MNVRLCFVWYFRSSRANNLLSMVTSLTVVSIAIYKEWSKVNAHLRTNVRICLVSMYSVFVLVCVSGTCIATTRVEQLPLGASILSLGRQHRSSNVTFLFIASTWWAMIL